MFIQFGYVTLFSSAYPLAGMFALLNNLVRLIEIIQDFFLLFLVQPLIILKSFTLNLENKMS